MHDTEDNTISQTEFDTISVQTSTQSVLRRLLKVNIIIYILY